MLSDLQLVEKRMETIGKRIARGGSSGAAAVDGSGGLGVGVGPAASELYRSVCSIALRALSDGLPLRALPWSPAQWAVVRAMGTISSKPVAYVCNVDDGSAGP